MTQGIDCLGIGNNHLSPFKLCPLNFVQGEPKVHYYKSKLFLLKNLIKKHPIWKGVKKTILSKQVDLDLSYVIGVIFLLANYWII